MSKSVSVSLFKPTVVRKGIRTKSAIWWIAWRDRHSGKLERRSTGARDRSTAKRIAAEHERCLVLHPLGLYDAARIGIPKPWTEAVLEFLDQSKARHRPDTTIAYRYCLDAFAKLMKPSLVNTVTTTTIEGFVRGRAEQGVEPATINKDLRHLRAFLRSAQRRGYLLQVPCFRSLFVKEDTRTPVVINDDDLAAIDAVLTAGKLALRFRAVEWWRVFVWLAVYLGLRRGEILGLTWGKVNLQTAEITVVSTASKGRRDRTLPIAVELLTLLQAWQDHQDMIEAASHVLPLNGIKQRRLYDDWYAILKAAGLPADRQFAPKHCRSTCASNLITAGVPTVVVKDWLGHASVTTTERFYVNTAPALRAASVARKLPPT